MPAARRTESTPQDVATDWEALPTEGEGTAGGGPLPRPAPAVLPTGLWGRPVRTPPSREHADAEPARPGAAGPRSFRPVPPPPRPPRLGSAPAPHRRRLPRPLTYRLLELAVAVLLLGGLAAAVRPRPVSPAPCAQAAWSQRAAGPVDALASDIAADTAAADGPLAPGALARLAADGARVRSVGPPPRPGSSVTWTQALDQLSTAVVEGRSGLAAPARQALARAGLGLTAVAGSGCGS